MTAKEYLEQAYRIDERIESKLTQIESLRGLAARVTSVFSDMPHSSTPDNQRLEKTVAEIIDLKNEINSNIRELLVLKNDITAMINVIPDIRQRTILEMRYLNFMTWKQIATKIDCDVRHIYRLHGQALVKIKKYIECH